MTRFEVVEEFQRFLERKSAEDLTFVRNETHFMAENCRHQGLQASHVPLYPLFLPPHLFDKYRRFSGLVHYAIKTILGIVLDPSHEHGEEMRKLLRVGQGLEGILHSQPLGGHMPRVIRPDTVLTKEGIKAHEFNVSWPGGISDSDICLKN